MERMNGEDTGHEFRLYQRMAFGGIPVVSSWSYEKHLVFSSGVTSLLCVPPSYYRDSIQSLSLKYYEQ
ncbi:hypothetical protein HPP92_007229 [Vanilla planifolia]|uniref:Uncharacterized protein n=1 Tax=Vanilla planifolia TaxID=51239 RepID=A0A835RK15_VANPL|nr:hypothetical protein HPP92_007229 [Vanilla planifolia]